MKVSRLKLATVRFKDNYNFTVVDKVIVTAGVYKFLDDKAKLEWMYKCGAYCGCERIIKDNKVLIGYSNKPFTQDQLEFIRNRAIMLGYNRADPSQSNYKGCGCAKNKR